MTFIYNRNPGAMYLLAITYQYVNTNINPINSDNKIYNKQTRRQFVTKSLWGYFNNYHAVNIRPGRELFCCA
jgi:hypothetical protein